MLCPYILYAAMFIHSLLSFFLHKGPGPPFGVMTLSNSSTQVIVSWEGVLDPNGIILLYEVLYLSTSDRQVRSVNITDNTSRTVVLSNLEEFTEYNITVRAYTSVGAGPETSAVTVRTLQESMFFITKLVHT